MIGYEFEFLVREGDVPLTRATYILFHKELANRGWKSIYDIGTGDITGSKNNGFYVTTDDGLCTMEINTPPRDTIGECDAQLRVLLQELQDIYHALGCSIVGTSVFPGVIDIENHGCIDICLDPQMCNKASIKYFNTQWFNAYHHALFYIAADQVWLDVLWEQALRQINFFNRLAPIIFTLFSNGPIANNIKLDILEGRDIMWKKMLDTSLSPEYATIYGMPSQPWNSLVDYFNFILDLPFRFGVRDGKAYRLDNLQATYRDFLFSKSYSAVYFDGTRFTAVPTVGDFFELQHATFSTTRLKYFIKPEISLANILSAITEQSDVALGECFNKVCLEIRSMSAQPQDLLSAPAAFVLGLQTNSAAVEKLLSQHEYDYWFNLMEVVLRDGLKAKYQGQEVTKIIEPLLEFATAGLRTRGLGEEKFLAPIHSMILQKENPAQELLQVWNQGGLPAVWATRDFQI